MCCDGTVFEHVVLREGEEALLAELLAGGAFVSRGEARAFLQPCRADSSGGCTIYQHRPSVCRGYHCETLAALRSGAIDPVEARRRIDEILAQRSALIRACGVSTLAEAREHVRITGSQARKDGAPLPPYTFDLLILQRLVDLYLREESRALTMGERSILAADG